MSNYKLMAFDVDGTLLTSDKRIADDTMAAIKAASDAGKIICISTGRNMRELPDLLAQLPMIDYVIAISGAYVANVKTGQVLFSSTISPELAKELFDLTADQDLLYHIHGDQSIIPEDEGSRMTEYNMGIYQEMFDRVTLKVPNLPEFCAKERPNIYKLNLYCRSTTQRSLLNDRLASLPLELSYAETASLECSPNGISKGTGLVELCRHLGINIADTIAIGDSENDLAILKTAGLGIAMGNSRDAVLAAADVVVKDNDHGGCAEAIYKYLI